MSLTAESGGRNRDRADPAAKLQAAAALNDQHVVRSRKMSISMRICLLLLNVVHVDARNNTTSATARTTTTPFSTTPMPSTTTPTQNASSEVPGNFVVIGSCLRYNWSMLLLHVLHVLTKESCPRHQSLPRAIEESGNNSDSRK
jgi:hypothetical protein